MTLSNFDWTDKTSVKWFIMLPTGHEGPYSLEILIQKNTSKEVKVWAEGLSSAVAFKVALENSQEKIVAAPVEDFIPPLPDIPVEEKEEDQIPPLPFEATRMQDEDQYGASVPASRLKRWGIITAAIFLISLFGAREWLKSQEAFSIRRATGMSPEIFERIKKDFDFQGWKKKIFFKEYIPADMSHIWLVTSGFQNCQVEATFTSIDGKLLAVEDEKVSFKATTKLSQHIAEFSNYDFINGNKIVPGLYEMDLKATSCEWEGLAAKLGNLFKPVDKTYTAQMKVVLYHRGSGEFNTILDKLIRKKMEIELKNQNQEDLFWQDLQQKLQTLVAISLQIEQLFLDFTDKSPAGFDSNLKATIAKYTRNFGRFLTDFVVANEKYFEDLEKAKLVEMEKKRNYERLIRLTAKNVGMESIKIIEKLQTMKKPSAKELKNIEGQIKKQFDLLKENLNQEIIQLTEDRVKN
jgi:hypothetical protein